VDLVPTPEKSVMPLPSSRQRRNARNRWNTKARWGLLCSGSLGLAILGGWAYDHVDAAGRARLGAETAARSHAGATASAGRARLGSGLVDSIEHRPVQAARPSVPGRVRLVSAEEPALDQDADEAVDESPRRAIPAALEISANRRARVRPVQYNESGYVPELPASTDVAEEEELESSSPEIRSRDVAEPVAEEMSESTETLAPGEGPDENTGETSATQESSADDRISITPEPDASSTETSLLGVEESPASPPPAPALPPESSAEAAPEVSETLPEDERPAATPSETLVPESVSQYAEGDDNALAQEGLTIQPQVDMPEDEKSAAAKPMSAADICRKYQPKPIGTVGLGVKPAKAGAIPTGKDDPAQLCFPKETEHVGQYGWYDNCPYGNYLFVCHGPLYFEEVDAERFGETWGAWVQPSVTAGKFFGTVPMVPYKWFANTFSEEQYGQDNFGQARNGYAEGRFIPPFHAGAAAFTGGLVTGLFFLIP
jgi:hypothetical protein